MCGIAGYFGNNIIAPEKIHSALLSMNHRGPDNAGSSAFRKDGMACHLLHTRLSIIDLEERSNQPFTIGDYTLVFNGEIYNYIELRQELISRGETLRTESDVEVLLRYYMIHGPACVDFFEGMWAFAVYDSAKGELFLSRDRFGEKPLYLLRDNGGIYFASEIKTLRALSGRSPDINNNHIRRYLVNGYKSLFKTNETFFDGVEQLPAATNLTMDHSGNECQKEFWTPRYAPQEMTLETAVEGFREHLFRSMELRLRADVPLAFCLSGGVDSSALVAIAAKRFGYDVHTFSIIDEDERYNERDNIEANIADLECRNTVIDIPKTGFLERMRRLIEFHDGPVATISYYIHSFLSEAIAKEGYRVVCSGTAADELVTGYFDHYLLHLHTMRGHAEYSERMTEWQKHILPLVRNPNLQNPELYDNNPDFREHVYMNADRFSTMLRDDFNEPFTEVKYSDNLLRNRMLNELRHEVIPSILHEDDLNSMMFSIENRSPYLDRELCEFAYTIPPQYLIRNGYNKFILREAVRGWLNEKVRTDRHKKGFNASIHSLLDFDGPEGKAVFLDNGPIFDIVRRDKIEELLKIKPLPNAFSMFLFNFINVRLFMDANGSH